MIKIYIYSLIIYSIIKLMNPKLNPLLVESSKSGNKAVKSVFLSKVLSNFSTKNEPEILTFFSFSFQIKIYSFW